VDHTVIEALYRASQAGVPIDVVARGICCLRPGVRGLSETIRVRSIVDRFLEHSRIYVFGPDDDAKVYLSSADWMPRNFFRRVELMFPVLAPELSSRILKEIIPVYLADNMRARQLDAEGVFHLLHPGPGETPLRCQIQMLEQPASEADAFAVSGASAGGDGSSSQAIDRLATASGGGRSRGSAGKSRKSRG
jgi:polyphosphate kinase